MQTQIYTPSIERGITRLKVAENITFAHPFAGPNDYRGIAQEILKNKVKKMYLPDGEKTSYLVRAVYCGPQKFQSQPESIELREQIMKPRYLWLFQRNLWIPKEVKTNYGPGVFVVYDEKGVGTSEELDIGELERELKGGRKLKNGIIFSEDEKTSFAPRNTYREGEMSSKEFANDGFIIISNKEQGARNLAEVSQSNHFEYKKPSSWIVDPGNKPVQTVSALGYRFFCDNRLVFGGYLGGRGGHASGVLD